MSWNLLFMKICDRNLVRIIWWKHIAKVVKIKYGLQFIPFPSPLYFIMIFYILAYIHFHSTVRMEKVCYVCMWVFLSDMVCVPSPRGKQRCEKWTKNGWTSFSLACAFNSVYRQDILMYSQYLQCLRVNMMG